MIKKATFAGGCFWCTEAAYRKTPGVSAVTSGYSGGDIENPTYYNHPGYREAVQITYDDQTTKYQDLLKIYWANIDTQDEGGQYYDRGFSYTTAIFFHDQEQQQIAEQSKKEQEPLPVTPIIPYKNFYPAEEEHQNYANKNPLRYMAYKKGSGRTH